MAVGGGCVAAESAVDQPTRGRRLRFASSSARLAHSLENLDISDQHQAHSLPANELVHLRSLGALRRLKLRLPCITPAVGHQVGVDHTNCTDTDAASLVSLTSLRVDTQRMPVSMFGTLDSGELDLSLLGPMPQLRSCQLKLSKNVQVTSIATALAHSSHLLDLRISLPSLTDSHLVDLMPHLTQLRSLVVQSQSHFGGLAFVSPAVAPRLAATLTDLTLGTTDTTPMKSSDLHHLRAFANLTELHLDFPQSRAPFEADLDGLSLDSPRFRRECWPRLRHFTIHRG